MNVSDLDCPQYVCFDSENFQKKLQETSDLSVDSLDTSEYSDDIERLLISGDLTPTCTQNYTIEQDGEETQHMESTRFDCDGNMDQENFGSFPIQQPKTFLNNVKNTSLKVTVPKPFQFQTDNRIKNKQTDGSSIYQKKDFVSELRQNIILQPHNNRPTKQQPFNLTEAKKRKREVEYLSMAEQITAFHKKTPERYHTSSHKEFQQQEHWNPPKLVAKSPKLQAMKRRRVVHALSKEERENKEIEEMKAYEFHARPVDPNIYKQPLALKLQPVTKVKSKDFRLKTTQRALMQLRNRTKSNKEKYQFKARPVPKAILSGTTGLKEMPVTHVTVPKAPAFEIESRLEKRKIHEQEKKVKEELLQKREVKKKHPVPAPSVPYHKTHTDIQPFSFDKADKERFSQKEKKIQEEIEKESKPYVFRAQLMPFSEPSSLPAVQKLPPTEVKPFNFLLDNRSLKPASHSFQESTTFKAQPATVLRKEPFIPEKPPKHAIEIKEFSLHSEKRASERQHLREIKDKEDFEKQQQLMELKAIEEEKEHQELIRLRREIVHKANPVRQYKPLELKPSSMPLTKPESPKFETDKRLRTRNDSTM